MKRYIYIVLSIIAFGMLGACENNLDSGLRMGLSEDQVYLDYNRTISRGMSAYTYLQEGFAIVDGAMMASTCDEAEHTLETSAVQRFNSGAWNQYDNPNNAYGNYFRGIRMTNDFLANTDSVNLDFWKLDPAPNQQLAYLTKLADLKRAKYENRFLRAFFYFELVKRYGGVPIITKAIKLEEDFSSLPRNTLNECMKFITDECDSAASNLPLVSATADLGRATKGSALALKSKALLYAASDLFNTPPAGYAYPKLVSMPAGNRIARWQAAADAAQAVMNLATYSLASNYRNLFQTYNSPEIIFTRRNSASNTFEQASFPIGFDGGNSGTTPSQNLVDAYEVKVNATTAEPFDWNNPVHAANPYRNRDPRLDASIITNSSLFRGGKTSSRAVECWTGGIDGNGVPLATKTGYYLKKYVDEALDLLNSRSSVHSWIYIRYAEILLNYAEALNEAQGPVAEVYTNVNAIRNRSGVAMPPLPAGLTQAQMRDKIRNERRVEFAFEDHRPWDVRRWMLGETYFNAPLRGVQIKNNAGVFTYTPINVENRKFESKMYLYPIPQSELNIMKGWVQNPGW